MDTTSSNPLLDAIRALRLLDSEHLKQLAATTITDPKSLAKDLIQRGWLTPYQANQLLTGKGHELVLGSYVLMERLGEGGMGQVFKARHRTLGRISAIKLIRKERLDNASAIKRFQREVRSAAALSHPNIVLAYDADEIAGTHLMVMEYIEGAIDLAKLVKKNGPSPVDRACEYIRQAAVGLQHAYERGMVHRDIKPANLLLTADGKLVKVLDMGLARLDQPAEDGDSSSTMTQEGAVMGTPDYIAPEQALDTHTVDIRADLYSLGCTFYYLLTGRVPFPGGTLLQKLNKHQNDEPIPVEKLRPEVQPAVARVVRRLMAKNPGDRYQTPAELAAALAAVSQSLTGIAAGAIANEATIAETSPAAPATPSSADSLKSALAYIEKRTDTVAYQPTHAVRKNPKNRRWLVVTLGTGLSAFIGLAVILLLIPNPKRKLPPPGPPPIVPPPPPIVDAPPPALGRYALSFDGVSSYVTVPFFKYDGSHSLTVEAWTVLERAVDDPAVEYLFGNSNGSGFGMSNGGPQVGALKWGFSFFMNEQKDYAKVQEKKPLPRKQLIHMAGVYARNGEVRFYVNGQLQERAPAQGTHKPGMAGIVFGEHFKNAYFRGRLNEVRISKIVRYDKDFKPGQRVKPDADTMALYEFDEGSGDVLKDSSGNGHDGKIVGAKWVKADGTPITRDFALQFDGKSSYVEIPNLKLLPSAGPFTAEAWVRTKKTPAGTVLASVGPKDEFSVGWHNTFANWLLGITKPTVCKFTLNMKKSGTEAPLHLAAVWDGNRQELYVNGTPAQHLSDYKPINNNEGQSPRFYLGAMLRNGKDLLYFFEGTIDEVRISKIARYHQDFTPAKRFEPDKDTLALYHFDEGAGDVLKDSSGNKRDGKIVGAKWVKADGSPIPTVAPANFALQFDGVKSYVEVPTLKLLPSAGPFTAEAWVRMKSTGRFGVILQSVGPNDEFQIAWHQPQLGWCAQVAQPKLMSVSYDVKTKATGLVHLAAIWDGKRPQLFVNGLLIQHQDASAQWLTDNFGVSPRFLIGVGMKRKDMGNWFAGTIDEIRISKIARYTKDFTPAKRFEPDADTLALYHFDEGAGDVLKDSSGNGHHGKIVGAKWVKADGTPLTAPDPSFFNGKDLTGWTVAGGTWRVENGAIVGTHGNQSGWNRLRLDRTLPKDFELTFEALSANAAESQSTLDFRIVGDSGVALRLAEMPGRLFLLARAGAGPLLYAAPKQTDLNAYQKIHLRVVGKRITVTVNGMVLTDKEHKDLPDGDRLAWVLAPKSPELRIRNIQFIDLSKSAAVPTIDLLPLIDPAKDAVKGDWKFNEKGELVSDKALAARIRIPYQAPTEYDLLVSFTKLSGPDSVTQVLVGGGRQFVLTLGGYGNTLSFFETVDGKNGDANPTTKPKGLITLKRYESRVEIRKNSARAYLDGALVTELLQTDFKNVGVAPWWEMNVPGVLGLGSWSPMAFHKVQVVELSGPGTFTRPNDPAAKKAAEQRKTALPGPWRPLLDAGLTRWNHNGKGVAATEVPGEPLLTLQGDGSTSGRLMGKTLFQNSHLRLEFQTPNKGSALFAMGLPVRPTLRSAP